MNKAQAEAKVAQANVLHARMEAVPSSLAEFDAIAEQYQQVMGSEMMFRTAVLDEVLAHATQQDIDAAWARR